MHKTSHMYRALPQRKDSTKEVSATERDCQGIALAGFSSHTNERQGERERHGYVAPAQNIRVECREHFIEPSDNYRSEQNVHLVAGNAENT